MAKRNKGNKRGRGGRKRESITSGFFQPTALEAKLLDQAFAQPNILDALNSCASDIERWKEIDNIAKIAFQIPQEQGWCDDLMALRMRTLVDQRLGDKREGLLSLYITLQNCAYFNHRGLKDINSAYRCIPCDPIQRAELACLCARTYITNDQPDKALECLPDIIAYAQEGGGLSKLQNSDALFAEGMQLIKEFADIDDDTDKSDTKTLKKRYSKIYDKLAKEGSEDCTGGSLGRAFDLVWLGQETANVFPSLAALGKTQTRLRRKIRKEKGNELYVFDATVARYFTIRASYEATIKRGAENKEVFKNNMEATCKAVLHDLDVLSKRLDPSALSLHVKADTEAMLNEVTA